MIKKEEKQWTFLLKQFSFTGPLMPIRQKIEGKVKGSKLRYLFETYDSKTKPAMLHPEKTKRSSKQDSELYERTRPQEGIEAYVEGVYS